MCSLRHGDKSRPSLGLSPHRGPEAFAPRSVSQGLCLLWLQLSLLPPPKALRSPGLSSSSHRLTVSVLPAAPHHRHSP